MEIINLGETISKVKFADKEIILVGTAHVSEESVNDVEKFIKEENPDNICVEIDSERFAALKDKNRWKNLDIFKILKEGKAFLFLANLVLSSFQKKLGSDIGINPGQEMMRAIELAEERNIPFALCDRNIQLTLKRAWARAGFITKNKMLASMLGSIFVSEKLSKEDIEKLKNKDAMHNMMEELAAYMPSVKEVLIDERDRYLASKIYDADGKKKVAVVGAGHMKGILQWLEKFENKETDTDVSAFEVIPPKKKIMKILPWLVPALVFGLIGSGFFKHGLDFSLNMLLKWVLANGILSALGALLVLAHPVTILTSFIAAPITSMNPTIGVGLFSGLCEAFVKKPRVKDFENLQNDILTIKGFFKNRLTHTLLVFVFSSLGSTVGTVIALPWLSALLV